MTRQRLHMILGLGVLLAALYFPLFLHLDSLPLRLYDEARRANNALEMALFADPLVPRFHGLPDLWGTKPPLLIWLQAGCMTLIGYNALALRLPAALAGLAAALLLATFGWRRGRPLTGGFAALVLVTSPGYIAEHVTRTGDYDAVLSLWMTAALLSFFLYTEAETEPRRGRWLVLSAAFTALAVLTKSIVGLMFLPAMVLYLLLRGQLAATLRYQAAYLALGLALVMAGGYYGLRELADPGYLAAVRANELGGRYLSTLENHYQDNWFFLRNLTGERFRPWIFLLPLPVIALRGETASWRRCLGLTLLAAASFLAVISFSQTKLAWYDAPVYPPLALAIGYGLDRLWNWLKNRLPGPVPAAVGLVLFTVLIFARPYAGRVQYTLRTQVGPEHQAEKIAYGRFLGQLGDLPGYIVPQNDYNSHLDFHRKVANLGGQKAGAISPQHLKPGELAVICEPVIQALADQYYEYEVLREQGSCRLLRILRKKD